jgi:hypothetical protein
MAEKGRYGLLSEGSLYYMWGLGNCRKWQDIEIILHECVLRS